MNGGFSNDYYKVLGIEPNVLFGEIKEAYLKLAKLYHPDVGGDLRKMQLLTEAYTVLSNPESKQVYDSWYSRNFTDKNDATGEEESDTYEEEDVNSFSQYYDLEELYRQTVEANKSNYVYDVSFFGRSIKIPSFSSCCLGEADQKFEVYKTETESKGMTKLERTISLSFPICSNCVNHIKDYKKKQKKILIYSSILGVIAGLLFNSFIFPLSYGGFIFTCLSFSIIILIILNQKIKLSPLKDFPVEMRDIYENMVTLRFWNKFHAETIANANGRRVKTIDFKRNDRKELVLKRKPHLVFIYSIIVTVLLSSGAMYILQQIPSIGTYNTSKAASTAQTSESAKSLPQPYTGTFRKYSRGDDIAPFRIITSKSDSNYFVKLNDYNSDKTEYIFFIRDGDTLDVNIKVGTYRIKYAYGTEGYGESDLFGKNTAYATSDEKLNFNIEGNRVVGNSITLYKVSNGNFHTKSLPISSF